MELPKWAAHFRPRIWTPLGDIFRLHTILEFFGWWHVLGASVTTVISVVLGILGKVPAWGLFLMALAACALSLNIVSKILEMRARRVPQVVDNAPVPASPPYWPSVVILVAILGFGAWRAVSRPVDKGDFPKPIPAPETKSEAPKQPPQGAQIKQPPSRPDPRKAPDPKQRSVVSRVESTETIPPKTTAPIQPQTVTNNCPNGICISGGTVEKPTVNNFGTMPRVIDDEKRRVIGRLLIPFKDQSLDVYSISPDKEVQSFARALAEAIAGAELNVAIGSMMHFGITNYAVQIRYGTSRSELAKAIRDGLVQTNLCEKPDMLKVEDSPDGLTVVINSQ